MERSSRGRLNTIVSRPAPCAPTSIAKRSAKASITSSTSASGAEAPAVIPSREIPSNCAQSIALARSTSIAFGASGALGYLHQPHRVARTSGAPTTIIASTFGATRFTASCRFVVA